MFSLRKDVNLSKFTKEEDNKENALEYNNEAIDQIRNVTQEKKTKP